MVCLLRKSMKAFTFQLVLCLVEVACLKIIGRITQRLNAKNVEESGCGSDKRHEKIYIYVTTISQNTGNFQKKNTPELEHGNQT